MKKVLISLYLVFICIFGFSGVLAETIGLDKESIQQFTSVDDTKELSFSTPWDGSIVISERIIEITPIGGSYTSGEVGLNTEIYNSDGTLIKSYKIYGNSKSEYIPEAYWDTEDSSLFWGRVNGEKTTTIIRTGNIELPSGTYRLVIKPFWYINGGNAPSTTEGGFPMTTIGVNAHYYTAGDTYNDENSHETNTPTIPVYRLYHPVNNEHLYTTDVNEDRILISSGWDDEHVGWYSPVNGEPVYRLYNAETNAHLYTKDQNEINVITQRGWVLDNESKPMFYSGGNSNVYRLYNPTIRMHLLTTDLNEYNTLAHLGWNQEGVGFNCN